MTTDRHVHRHIKAHIEKELGDRSWNWLAEESGIPQSTLAGQASRPKFSLDVLLRIASALHRPPSDFLPQTREGVTSLRPEPEFISYGQPAKSRQTQRHG